MCPSKFHIFALFLFLISNLSVIHAVSQISPYIFREYIGALGLNVTFSDVPIYSDVEFHFILSFAIDYAVANNTHAMNSSANHSNQSLAYPTNGDFNIYWDTVNLSPFHVSDIKAKHPNVKVAMSLGGDTVYNAFVNFSPISIDTWVSNAISSITKIVNEYHLDGIDIDYEHFNTDPDTFAECIGKLLFHLKENNIISFASIAPYGNETIQEHYTLLWSKYGHLIDYVNFQFYAYKNTTTLDQFLHYFDTQIYNYAGGKILVSFSTGGNGGLTPRHGFFKACKILHTAKKFHGIFIWSADNSMEADFHYEKKSQHFLAHAS